MTISKAQRKALIAAINNDDKQEMSTYLGGIFEVLDILKINITNEEIDAEK
jgi:hypothetical protein